MADEFAQVRPRLFGIAYRMLGSIADAEDIVQDVWVKWQGHDRASVRDATGFLVTMTTRLAINATQTARARRETYVGPWLPEPVDTTADPALGAERGEALESAVLVLLEKLTPTERAAFVLREAFDHPYDRIAEVLQSAGHPQRRAGGLVHRHRYRRGHRPDPLGHEPGEAGADRRRGTDERPVAAHTGRDVGRSRT
ncbi:sigma factor [Pseudonocardia sp. DLS-67]